LKESKLQLVEDRPAIVDEIGDLDSELNTADRKKKEKRLKALRAKASAWYENEAGDKVFEVEGNRYTLILSEKANEREYKPGALRRLATRLGARFWQYCKLSLGDFDDQIALEDRAKYVDEAQTGARRLEIVAKPVSKAA
jgi:hypothetical protein